MIAADGVLRLAQIAGDLLPLHHRGPAFGKGGLLAVFGLQLFQFVGSMPQIIGLARGALHACAMRFERSISSASGVPERLQCRHILFEAGKRVEQAAVARGIHQRPLVMLTVNFNQRGADRPQGLDADRLIVDEGAGAAIGELHAAQNHLAGIVEPVIAEDAGGGMALRYVEHRGDLALLDAMTHKAGVAAAAERQRECIEQDGFARAGFAGQHREATGKFDIEPFDQDDVTDRQTRQHAK